MGFRGWLTLVAVALGMGLAAGVVIFFAFGLASHWGILGGIIVVGLVIVWCAGLADLARRADLAAWQIAGWVAAMILFPVLGLIAYTLFRPPADQIRYRGEQQA